MSKLQLPGISGQVINAILTVAYESLPNIPLDKKASNNVLMTRPGLEAFTSGLGGIVAATAIGARGLRKCALQPDVV